MLYVDCVSYVIEMFREDGQYQHRQTLSGRVLQCADLLISVFLFCLTGYEQKRENVTWRVLYKLNK